MRWFKHMTAAHDDPKMALLIAEYGLEGYGFYWLVVETISSMVDPKGQNAAASVTYPVQKWRTIFAFSAQKLRKLAEFCSENEIFSAKFEKVSEKSSQEMLTIDCPKILKYRDEYTRRNSKKSGQTPGTLRSKNTDTDTDTECSSSPHSPPQDSESPPTPVCPAEELLEIYNYVARKRLPTCQNIEPSIRRALEASWAEDPERQDSNWWNAYFLRAVESKYLRGEVKDWRATFDWLVQSDNVGKVMSGRFDNREGPPSQSAAGARTQRTVDETKKYIASLGQGGPTQ